VVREAPAEPAGQAGAAGRLPLPFALLETTGRRSGKPRRGRWRSGLASVLDHDDPLARARWLADTLGPLHRADHAVARLLGTDLLTIRIELEPCQPTG
jgi:hypothetical protein